MQSTVAGSCGVLDVIEEARKTIMLEMDENKDSNIGRTFAKADWKTQAEQKSICKASFSNGLRNYSPRMMCCLCLVGGDGAQCGLGKPCHRSVCGDGLEGKLGFYPWNFLER